MSSRITAVIFFGAAAGAVGFSALTVVWHMVFAPQLLRDGLYFIILIGTIPTGALLGAFTCAAGAIKDNPRVSGTIACIGGVMGFGAVVMLILLHIVGMRVPEDIFPVWGHGVIWSAALLVSGCRRIFVGR